jgi:hypothetical protein
VGEELSQSLARPESIGVLACEAMHSETFIPKRKFSLPQYWRGYATYLAHLHCQHLTSSFRLETILLVILSAAKNLLFSSLRCFVIPARLLPESASHLCICLSSRAKPRDLLLTHTSANRHPHHKLQKCHSEPKAKNLEGACVPHAA